MKEKLLAEYKSRTQPGPLNGIIVMGFCYYVAGPIALQSLVRQGALVVKVEAKPNGDPSRNVFSPAIFNSLAHGQLSIAVNYKEDKDRQLLDKLLNIADVIVDNRSVDARERDEVLQNYLAKSSKSTSKIYCSIDGFPNATINRMPGLDASVQAITGFAYSNCVSKSAPLKVGVPVLDIVSGLQAANHIVANLFFLEKNKSISIKRDVIYIAVSLAGISMWLQSNQVINALEGNEYFRKGNQDKFAAPFSYYTARDGLISIATVNEKQFENFCLKVLKNAEFHEKYPSVQKRIACQDDFEDELNRLLKDHDKEYWMKACQKYSIPVSPVLTVSEAVQQPFFKDVIMFGDDEKPIISAGISHSIFAPQKIGHAPAPNVDQDHELISQMLSIDEPKPELIRSRL